MSNLLNHKMGFLHFINENNKERLNKPANTDQVYYSELNDWYTTNAFRSFSIKHVLEGSIYYHLGKREYKISKDSFLIATQQPEVVACFHSRQIVKSICIDICENSIADAFTTLKNEQQNEITEFNADCLKHPVFPEAVHSLQEKFLSDQLLELTGLIKGSSHATEPLKIGDDWFFRVVELIALFEMRNQKFGKNLSVQRASTRKEILKRALTGKEFMDAWYLKNPAIKNVARESNMSEFHFYRCFKKIFGTTPYQYMLSKRLEHAKSLLNDKTLLIGEIAKECSFPDLYTFSKAFKKMYGKSPTKIVDNGPI